MSPLSARVRSFLFPLLFLCMSAYFAYHVFHGKKGIWAYFRLEECIDTKKKKLKNLQEELLQYENKIRLLRPGHIDPDLLEERVRTLLNYGNPNELVILDKDLG